MWSPRKDQVVAAASRFLHGGGAPTSVCTATPHPFAIQVSGHGFSRAVRRKITTLPCAAGPGPRHARFSRGGVEDSRAATRSANKQFTHTIIDVIKPCAWQGLLATQTVTTSKTVRALSS